MIPSSTAAVLAIVSAALAPTPTLGQSPVPPAGGLDSAQYAALAAHLIADGYRIKPGDKVVIGGGTQTLPFMEAVAIEVLKAGAHPYLQIDTERLMHYTHYDMPLDYLGRAPNAMDEALIHNSDLEIRMPSTVDYRGLHGGMPAERRAKENTSENAWNSLNARSKERYLYVGMPSDADTAGTGLSGGKLRSLWYEAAMVDSRQMGERAELVRRRLASAKAVRITSKDGTDLTFTLGQRPVIDVGPMTAEHAKEQPAARRRSALPAGIVTVSPVASSANGVVKTARDQCDSMVVDEVIEVRNAAPVGIRAASGEDCVRNSLKETDLVGHITVGLNPAIKPIETNGAYYVSDRGLGLVTINFGDSDETGGGTQNGNWFVVLSGATLVADGKAIVRDGLIVE